MKKTIATTQTPATPLPIYAAATDIIVRAQQTMGRYMWNRLSQEGQIQECRALMCGDMLRDDTGLSVKDWWLPVMKSIINSIG
jgi:hypothetical protein